MKPTILLTGRPGLQFDKPACTNYASYHEFFLACGGLPVTCAPIDQEMAEEYACRFDALCITGGEDVNPALYHEDNTHSSVIASDYEAMDLALYRAFKRAGKPILGICRGLQIINVAEGGSLYQDLLSQCNDVNEHNQRNLGRTAEDKLHDVHVIPDTQLSEFFPDGTEVNSFHHQAVKQTASALHVSALSKDGIVEAVETEGVLAVQWHPERLIQEKSHLSIGRWLVDQALQRKIPPTSVTK